MQMQPIVDLVSKILTCMSMNSKCATTFYGQYVDVRLSMIGDTNSSSLVREATTTAAPKLFATGPCGDVKNCNEVVVDRRTVFYRRSGYSW